MHTTHIPVSLSDSTYNFSRTQFQPVTARRVKDLLMKMNEKKAAGHDRICSKELKVVADKIAWQLAILFNESLETGEIPSDFKVGNIIPIFKSGKKDVTVMVSLLNCCCC